MIEQIIFVPKYDFDQLTSDKQSNIKFMQTIVQSVCIQNQLKFSTWNNRSDDCTAYSTLFVVAGGDGSMLDVMKETKYYEDAKIYGINFGKLGFLTTIDGHIDVANIQAITDTKVYNDLVSIVRLPDNWITDERTMITGEVNNSGMLSTAVNEFLITTPTRRNPLTYTISINGNEVATQSGDGVIISTATGSTAYAMSAGGAIMSPNSTSMQIVPLAAHTLTSRPLIVNGDDTVTIDVDTTGRVGDVSVFNDGNNAFNSYPTDTSFSISVSRVRHTTANIVRKHDWNFYNTLQTKLKWG